MQVLPNYNRCKFDPCKFEHFVNLQSKTELEKHREETHVKFSEIDSILNEKKDLEVRINSCNEKLEEFNAKISELETKLIKKDEKDERLALKKKSILERLEVIEKRSEEIDKQINILSEK